MSDSYTLTELRNMVEAFNQRPYNDRNGYTMRVVRDKYGHYDREYGQSEKAISEYCARHNLTIVY